MSRSHLAVNDVLIVRRVQANYGDTQVIEETEYIVLEVDTPKPAEVWRERVVVTKTGSRRI